MIWVLIAAIVLGGLAASKAARPTTTPPPPPPSIPPTLPPPGLPSATLARVRLHVELARLDAFFEQPIRNVGPGDPRRAGWATRHVALAERAAELQTQGWPNAPMAQLVIDLRALEEEIRTAID